MASATAFDAYKNYRTLLNEHLQKMLLQSIELPYNVLTNKDVHQATLTIGRQNFRGAVACCKSDAKESVAKIALVALKNHKDEAELRTFLGFPQRNRNAHINKIREDLRPLKKFLEKNVSTRNLLYIVGQVYDDIDDLEERLGNITMTDYDMAG